MTFSRAAGLARPTFADIGYGVRPITAVASLKRRKSCHRATPKLIAERFVDDLLLLDGVHL
jgi:hypothetical protein